MHECIILLQIKLQITSIPSQEKNVMVLHNLLLLLLWFILFCAIRIDLFNVQISLKRFSLICYYC